MSGNLEIAVRFESSIWDRTSLREIALLKEQLRKQESATSSISVVIDLETVTWAEPCSMLALAVVLNNYQSKIDDLTVLLGDTTESSRLQFLTFIARQGFVSCFPSKVKFMLKTESNDENSYDRRQTETKLASIRAENAFRRMDAISARIIDLGKQADQEEKIAEYVEALVQEARIKSHHYNFLLSHKERDQSFHRLRKFLFEAILNSSEHAYENGVGHAAVYARVREGVPADHTIDAWHAKYSEEQRKGLAFEFREHNINSEWVEVFVVDAGAGILGHSNSWLQSIPNSAARVKLQDALRGPRPLNAVGAFLFRLPLSRHGKSRGHRTNETGLQEIARTLNQGGGYLRIVDGLEAIGAKFPWLPQNIASIGVSQARPKDEEALGTCLCLSYQPFADAQRPRTSLFTAPSKQDRERLFAALSQDDPAPSKELFFDRRDSQTPRPTKEETRRIHEALLASSASIVYVRLPKSATKRDIGHWINDLGDLITTSERTPPQEAMLVFPDLKAFHAELVADFISKLRPTSRWAFSRIAICTLGFDFLVLENIRGRFVPREKGRSRQNENRDSGFLISVARVLRGMDTTIFWDEGQLTRVSSFYENAKVSWATTTFPQRETNLQGYVDFSQAMVEPARYRVCRRALARIVLLLQPRKIIASDDLVVPIIKDIQGEFPIRDETQGGTLIVASVNVTGSTISRFSERADVETPHVVSFINRNTEARNVISLINWWPPSVPQSARGLQRVSGTPFVSARGDKSVLTPRMFGGGDGKSAGSFYPRSPQETYLDFVRAGAIAIDHRETSLRHDLIAFNTIPVLERAKIENSTAWKWIVAELDKFVGDSKSNWVVVFPNSQGANAIVQGYLSSRTGTKEVRDRFYPLNFLRDRSIEPYLISPLLEEKLSERFRSSELPVRALVVDSVTLSGNTIRQITQLIQSCAIQSGRKAAEVHSLALVDRSGFPVYAGVMEAFKARHHRFWRWDVPTLGRSDTCPVCAGLLRARTFERASKSSLVRTSLMRWIAEWQTESRHRSEVNERFSIALPASVKMKFGFYSNGSDTEAHEVLHTHSITLVSHIVEVTRLTHRSDIALKAALQRVDESPLVALQILTVVYLLFGRTFRFWERFAYAREMLKIVLGLPPEVSTESAFSVSLCCLALVTLDKEMLNELNGRYLDEYLGKSEVLNRDACTLMGILYSDRFGMAAFHRLAGVKGKNLQRFRVAVNGLSGLADFFEVVGLSASEWHKSSLQRSIDGVLRHFNKGYVSDSVWAEVGQILSLVRRLKSALEMVLDDFELVDVRPLSPLNPSQDLARINRELEEVVESLRLRDGARCAEGLRTVHGLLYGGSDRAPGLARRYSEALLQHLKVGSKKDLFIRKERASVKEDWSEYLRSKEGLVPNRWFDSAGEVAAVPLILTSDGGGWEREGYAFMSDEISEAIKVSLQNVIHAGFQISSPWDGLDPDVVADMWVKLDLQEHYLSITFANGSDAPTAPTLKSKECFDKFRDLGGIVVGPWLEDRLFQFELRVPMIARSLTSGEA